MKLIQLLPLVLTTVTTGLAQDFCYNSYHSGQYTWVNTNKVGQIGNIGYEMWADAGYNTATFFSDGSFSCAFYNTKDYLCRTGLSFDSTKTHGEIGHMYADFKVKKEGVSGVDYSFVGVYGWTRNPLVEFYIVDNWLSDYRPGEWVGKEKKGDYTIDGAVYTVYKNPRHGPSIDGDTHFEQYFSVRQTPRECGTIDVTAHFWLWNYLGMTLGKMHEVKILGEAGSNGPAGKTSGSVDFPYAKVYIGNSSSSSSSSSSNVSYPKGQGVKAYTNCVNNYQWALAYDDGPTQYTDAILDLLQKYNIKATFFLVGNMYIPSYSSEWSRIVKRINDEGHIIGSHTYNHKDLTQVSDNEIYSELQQIENAIYNVIGKKPAFIRLPYGSNNQNVMNALNYFGITAACTWAVDPMDWYYGANAAYAKMVLGQLNGEGVITLNHLSYNGVTEQNIVEYATAEIEFMLSKGYKAVTMEECLGISAWK